MSAAENIWLRFMSGRPCFHQAWTDFANAFLLIEQHDEAFPASKPVAP